MPDILISHGTSVIVPNNILQKCRIAYNIHSASNEFPGRDPVNWAIYKQAKNYGAVLHEMTEKVDAGNIINALYFEIIKYDYDSILAQANRLSLELFEWLVKYISTNGSLPPANGIKWSQKKYKRNDLHNICNLELDISYDEFVKRYNAFNSNTYNNFYINLFGNKYNIKSNNVQLNSYEKWQNWTEDYYIKMLQKARSKYSLHSMLDSNLPNSPHIILRHDVDFCLKNALRIAKAEFNIGVRSTYFIQPFSYFYDIRDPSNTKIIDQIKALKHDIGLHFVREICKKDISIPSNLEYEIKKQADFIEDVLELKITAFTFHNLDPKILENRKPKIADLTNGYGEQFSHYKYCSDSNGYWIYKPIPEVIDCGEYDLIYMLTHPLWWHTHPLPPRQKIVDCINSRNRDILNYYDSSFDGINMINYCK